MWQSAYAASAVRVLNSFKPAEERSPGAIVHAQQDPVFANDFRGRDRDEKTCAARSIHGIDNYQD
ncbi:MAG: hypothetical protein CMJ91_07925 [Planctomycetes bacterium]|nr:hypothetical protein [Planctomycetota bacterium]MBL04072.1 hypothetical protein [Planctomycetota bacterium]